MTTIQQLRELWHRGFPGEVNGFSAHLSLNSRNDMHFIASTDEENLCIFLFNQPIRYGRETLSAIWKFENLDSGRFGRISEFNSWRDTTGL